MKKGGGFFAAVSVLLWAVCAVVGYLFAGNLLRGINGVRLISTDGASDAHFMGYYMLAGGYFAALLLCLAAAVIFTVAAVRCRQNKSVKTLEQQENI